MQIPIELSGVAIAGFFALFALAAVALTWVVCVVANEWREAGFEAGSCAGEREGRQ